MRGCQSIGFNDRKVADGRQALPDGFIQNTIHRDIGLSLGGACQDHGGCVVCQADGGQSKQQQQHDVATDEQQV